MNDWGLPQAYYKIQRGLRVQFSKAGRFADVQAITAETNLNVEAAKVRHEVLQRLHHCDTLMANHAMEDHLNAHAKEGDKHDEAECHAETECGRRQAAHSMDPDHEDSGAPMVVVATGVLGLGIDIAEGYLI